MQRPLIVRRHTMAERASLAGPSLRHFGEAPFKPDMRLLPEPCRRKRGRCCALALAHGVPFTLMPCAALRHVYGHTAGAVTPIDRAATVRQPTMEVSQRRAWGPGELNLDELEQLTMSNKEAEKSADTLRSTATPREDPLADTGRLISAEIPHGVDRRSFLMRTAVGGAAAVMTGCSESPDARTAKAVETLPQAAPSAGSSSRSTSPREGCSRPRGSTWCS